MGPDPKQRRVFAQRSSIFETPDAQKAPSDARSLLVLVSISRYYGLVGSSLSLSDAMMMPPTTATRARTAMIQLVLPSSSLWPSTAEAARAAGAADAATGAAIIEEIGRATRRDSACHYV